MNDNIKRLLKEYSLNTVDINVQLKLAKAYYDLGQYASAMSYINRVVRCQMIKTSFMRVFF